MRYIRDLDHSTFPAFLNAQRAAIVLLRTFRQSKFPEPLAEFFFNEHSHEIDFCSLTRSPTFALWAPSYFRTSDGSEHIEDGYYLFIDKNIMDHVHIPGLDTSQLTRDSIAAPLIIGRFKPCLTLHLSQPRE